MGFTIGIGNLFCDAQLANYTADARCRKFYPSYRANLHRRKTTLSRVLRESLGGSFAPDGDYRWPLADTNGAPPPKRALLESASSVSALGASSASSPTSTSTAHTARRPAPHLTTSGQVRTGLSAAVPADCARGQKAFRGVAFVHINKAGGTAMRFRLLKHARHQLLELSTPGAMERMRSLGARFFHASASLQRRAVGEGAWARAYTFALVRNPYARQVSMFHFLLSEASCNRPVGVRPSHCEKRKLPPPGSWLNDHEQAVRRFREWIRAMAHEFPPGSKDEHLFGARSHGNERDSWFNASQVSWLVDGRGQLLVKEVIKLEELEAKWPKLQTAVCGLARTNYDDGVDERRNPSHHAHYSEYYDDETRRTVESYMASDLAAFGYTFERKPATAAQA
jgi:hypothetical protein